MTPNAQIQRLQNRVAAAFLQRFQNTNLCSPGIGAAPQQAETKHFRGGGNAWFRICIYRCIACWYSESLTKCCHFGGLGWKTGIAKCHIQLIFSLRSNAIIDIHVFVLYNNSYIRKNWRDDMKNLPQISDAEVEVMDIIWKYAPISTNEITDRLAKTKDWSPKTIYTMLSRLEKKGVIVHEKESRVFVYTPCVKKDDYLAAESRTLADRFFDGAMKQMVVSFLDQKDLTPEDLDELQRILDKKRRQ